MTPDETRKWEVLDKMLRDEINNTGDFYRPQPEDRSGDYPPPLGSGGFMPTPHVRMPDTRRR